jgi:hypothetical protein
MAIDASGSGTNLDLNSLLQTAMAGGSMLGGDKGTDAGMLALLLVALRGGLLGQNLDGTNGVSQPQANMSIMSGIGDIKQAVAVAAESMVSNNANQTGQLSNQISGVAAALTNTVTMAKDSATQNAITLMQQLNGLGTVVMADGDKTRAAIAALAERLPSARELDLERQLGVAQANNRQAELTGLIRSGNVEVTNNITQNQNQMQQQQILNGFASSLARLEAEQRVTQGVLNIGSGTVSGNSQNAANTRVS